MLVLELPWPPSVNHYWRAMPVKHQRGCCRVVLSRAGRAYRERVCAELATHRRALGGRLHMKVTLHAPTRRAFDIDNRMKGLLDALEHARVYCDDGQIDRIEIIRGEIIKGGRAIVELEEVRG